MCLARGLYRRCGRAVAAIATLQFPCGAATAWESSVALQLLLSTGLAGNGVLPSLSLRAWSGDSSIQSSLHVVKFFPKWFNSSLSSESKQQTNFAVGLYRRRVDARPELPRSLRDAKPCSVNSASGHLHSSPEAPSAVLLRCN